jgi:elongator complex protein 1
MLNELRKLEPTYQKFTIDKHLKKYESALKHLKDCGSEHYEECLKFVADQKLHSAALKIFPPSHALYQVMSKLSQPALKIIGNNFTEHL